MLRWCCVLLLLLPLGGCPRPRVEPAAPGGSDSSVEPAKLADPLLQGLTSDMPDEHSFALFFITRFNLPDYHEQLTRLAPDDPTAAVACAVVYQDLAPLQAQMQPAGGNLDGSRPEPTWNPSGMLGAVYGLRCASEITPALWIEALNAVADAQREEFLWGLAQLDTEPGGPLKRSEDLDQALIEQAGRAARDRQLQAIAATDALLGGRTDWTVNWQRYIEQAPQLDWSAVQWTALLRWATPATWQAILNRSNLGQEGRQRLAQALAVVGVKDVALPGSAESWEVIGAGVEYRTCQFIAGKTPTIALPELDQLRQASDPATEAAALSRLLLALKYAARHSDTTAVNAALDALPDLSDAARSGILATLERFGGRLVPDKQLKYIATFKDPITAYWLVLGWPDRDPVQQADLTTLLQVSKGHEDVMLAYAFNRWRDLTSQMQREQRGG